MFGWIKERRWKRTGSVAAVLAVTVGGLGVVTTRSATGYEELYGWLSFSAGGDHSCAIKAPNRTLWCWGRNNEGQLGIGNKTDQPEPVLVSSHAWAMVSVGDYHTCGLYTNGTRFCWGRNNEGQLGIGDNTDRTEPRRIVDEWKWSSVDAGGEHSCGIRTDGRLYCWGENEYGQVGIEDRKVYTRPQLVSSSSWSMVSAGGYHTCALRSSGSRYCWGRNKDGELGLNDTNNRNLPRRWEAETGSWLSIDAGRHHTCGIRSNRALYCWGENDLKQLGTNDVLHRDVPTQVYGGGTWTAVSAGWNNTCAIRDEDGDLHCWGYGHYGVVGPEAYDRDETVHPNQGRPSHVLFNFMAVSVGHNHACGISPPDQSDSAVWCWGDRTYGQVGWFVDGADPSYPWMVDPYDLSP